MPQRFEEWQFEDYLRILWLHKWVLPALPVLFGALMFLYMAQKPDVYKATARILIETQPARVVEFQEVSAAAPWDIAFLQTEYQVISSRAVMSRVVDDLHLAAFPPFSSSRDPTEALKKMVEVKPLRGTKLVDIYVTGTKPELVAQLVNGVADSYARLNLERRREMTTGGAQWLREEVAKMGQKMQDAQLKLQEFKEEHSSIDFSEERQNSILQRVQALNASLSKTREDRIEAETKYREKHPVLQELMAKERELRLALFEEEQRALEMNRLSIQFSTLAREAKTTEEIHRVLLTRLKEISVQEGLQTNNVQVVDYALVPARPIGPARGKRTAIATILGLLLACGVIMAREALTRTVRIRQEFEHLLEIPFLGHVPLLAGRSSRSGKESLIILKEPKSPFVETLRSVRTTLEFILSAGEPHLLLITSALPEEGKSLVSANLAVALHELGRKVLLVDADMRRPFLHKTFEVPLEPGLSGFLQEEVSEQELIQSPAMPEGLSLVTAGLTPPQPVDLLSNPKFRDLLQAWKRDYQYILLDSPPVLVAADAAVLSNVVDGVVFIVRANRTHSEAALAAKQRLVDVGAKLIGGVLNGARLEQERGYRYYYSYRYYRGAREPRPA